MELSDPGLENDYVRLTVFGDAEKSIISESGAIQSLWDWMPRMPNMGTSFDAYFEYMMAESRAGRLVPFLAWRKTDNAFVGGVSFHEPSRTHRRVKIAYPWLTPDTRGTPVFTAMTALLVRRAADWRARRVSWQVNAHNMRMLRAMGRMGIPKEGKLRSVARLNNGEWADVVIHALVQDEITLAAKRLEMALELVD